jgi:predicted nucleic acid-binding protein
MGQLKRSEAYFTSHLAAMQSHGLTPLASNDPAFDRVK